VAFLVLQGYDHLHNWWGSGGNTRLYSFGDANAYDLYEPIWILPKIQAGFEGGGREIVCCICWGWLAGIGRDSLSFEGESIPVSSLAAASMGWVNAQSPAELVECLSRVGSLLGSGLPMAWGKGFQDVWWYQEVVVVPAFSVEYPPTSSGRNVYGTFSWALSSCCWSGLGRDSLIYAFTFLSSWWLEGV